MYQAAKSIDASGDAVADVLESVERFLRHIKTYTQIPHSPILDEMVVKVVLELLITLALATNRLTPGPMRESVLVDLPECHAVFGEEELEAVPRRLDLPKPDEARTTVAEPHQVVQNVNVVTDCE